MLPEGSEQSSAEALRRHEATYRAIAQCFPNGAIYVFDRDLRYEVVEGELLAALGQTPAALEGKTIWELFDPDTVRTIEPRYRRALAGESLHFETFYGEPFGNRVLAADYRPIRAGRTAADNAGDAPVVAGLLIVQDISQRVRMEADMRQAAQELAVALDSIADGLIVYDAAGRIVRMNSAAHEMLGYSPQAQGSATLGELAASIAPRRPDGSPIPPAEYPAARALAGETVRNEEIICRDANRPGHDLRLLSSSAPLRGPDGRVSGCVSTLTSINAYHEANRRLAQANAELEAMLAAVPGAMIVYDAAGRIVRINEIALDMLGYPEETWRIPVGERIPTSVQAIYPDGRPCPRDEYVALRVLRGEVVHGEEFYIHLPDHPARDFWAIFSGGPISGPDGKVTGAVVTWADTSQLHGVAEQLAQREAALAETAARLQEANTGLREAAVMLEERVEVRTAELQAANNRLAQREAILVDQAALLDLSHDAIFVRDLDGVLRYWNQGATEMYGWTAEEALGRVSHDLLATVFPRPRAEIEAQTLAAGRWDGELTHRRRDGSQVIVSSRWALKRDGGGRPPAILETNTDISGYKRSEAQREAVVRSLEESQAELRALSRRLVEIQERERSYVADQLYNQAGQVLAALNLQLRMLEQGQATGPELAEVKAVVALAMRELHALATQLRPAGLDHSSLVTVLHQYLADFEDLTGVAVQFSAHGVDGLHLSPGTTTAVYRTVQEALANAVRHAEASEVAMAVGRLESYLTISIEDNGKGFDPKAIRQHRGVGLVGMRERIESVGGRLTIESGSWGTQILLEVPLEIQAS